MTTISGYKKTRRATELTREKPKKRRWSIISHSMGMSLLALSDSIVKQSAVTMTGPEMKLLLPALHEGSGSLVPGTGILDKIRVWLHQLASSVKQ